MSNCHLRSLEAAEGGAFGGESFVFWRAQITADPVLVDIIDNELIAQTVRPNKDRHRFIGGAIFFGDAAVVGLDDNVELLPLDVGLLQLNQNIGDAREFLAL